MAPKQKNTKPSTRGKKAQNSQPLTKRTRLVSTTAALTRTIHQQVSSQSDQTSTVSVTMAQQLKCPAKNNKIPSSHSTSVGASASCSSGLTVHPFRAQHPSFQSPSPGMGQPMSQLPTPWWGLWGPPPLWATLTQHNPGYYNNWQQPGPGSYPWPQQQQQQQQQTQSTSTPPVQQQASHQSSTLSVPSTPSPLTAAYNNISDTASSNGSPAKEDNVNDPLVNMLAVSSVPGIKGQPYLSLHIANSI